MRRYTPLRQSIGTQIPGAVRRAVHERDQGCVAERAGFPAHECDRSVQQDHVRPAGMGMKSRSTLDNLVELCNTAHRWKTENGKLARPKLIAYIARASRKTA